MIRNVMIACGGVLAIGLMVSGSALAQNGPTYKFNVEVDMSDLHPNVVGGSVVCHVRDGTVPESVINGLPGLSGLSSSLVGEGETEWLISGSSYQGEISVEVALNNANLGRTPTWWDCVIGIQQMGTNSVATWQFPISQANYNTGGCIAGGMQGALAPRCHVGDVLSFSRTGAF